MKCVLKENDKQTNAAAAAAAATSASEFPIHAFVPKSEIQADQFIKDNPNYDGRGIIVAVLDTGIDPDAPGLHVTSDGKAKIVDIVDASGAGDVECTKKEAHENGKMLTLESGRVITIPETWNAAKTHDYRVGMKQVYALCPEALKKRVMNERKKQFFQKQQILEAQIVREITAFTQTHKANGKTSTDDRTEAEKTSNHMNGTHTCNEDNEDDTEHSNNTTKQKVSTGSYSEQSTNQSMRNAQKQKVDLETRLSEAKAMAESWDDPGELLDVVAFHDGTVWRAVLIPTSIKDVDIASLPMMTNFRRERQWTTLSTLDMLTLSVNIYEDGRIVSVCATAGSHGTHVAGIIAAHHPDKPELNGIAPGAQLVSITIGDHRLGSMETGIGLIRAFNALIENGAHIVNMSFGEATSQPKCGAVSTLAQELVMKHKIIFVSSAGNNGPALSTVGTLGGTEPHIIGVGAYVSPAMMEAAYSLRKKLSGQPYTWSSRGPTSDGALGVCISACGGAITSVPKWTLANAQLMNGTSMSSPSAAGGIALILSAMKQLNMGVTPQRVRFAIENTAKLISPEKFAYGCGLLQVADSWQYLLQHQERTVLDVHFDLKLPGLENSRGIYLRSASSVSVPADYTVVVEPKFTQLDFSGNNYAEVGMLNALKLNFEQHFRLVSSASFLEAPRFFFTASASRSFSVKVDPTMLSPGVHYAELLGFDAVNDDIGPLFRLPVTICKPEPEALPATVAVVNKEAVDTSCDRYETQDYACSSPIPRSRYLFKDVVFTPGHIYRRFVIIPAGAAFADIKVRASEVETTSNFMLHAIFLRPHTAYCDNELERHISLSSDEEVNFALNVQSAQGNVMELTLAHYWSSIGSCKAAITLSFSGVSADNRSQLMMHSHELIHRIDVLSSLAHEKLDVSATLVKLQTQLQPANSTITALPADRNLIFGNRQIYLLVQEYHFTPQVDGKVLMRFPIIQNRLYENIYYAQLCMVFDSNKRLVGSSDAFPKRITIKKNVKYTVRFHICSDQQQLLERLQDVRAAAEMELSKPLVFVVYASHNDAVLRQDKLERRAMRQGSRMSLFLQLADDSVLPSHAKPGDILTGKLYLAKPTNVYAGTNRPGGFPINLVIGSVSSKKKDKYSDTLDTEDSKPAFNADETLRDALLKCIRELSGKDKRTAFDAAWPALSEKWGHHLSLLSLKLHVLQEDEASANNDELLAVADEIIQQADTLELAAWFGVQHSDDETCKREHNEKQEIRDQLKDALHAKLVVLSLRIKQGDVSANEHAFLSTLKRLRAWAGDLQSTENKQRFNAHILLEEQLYGYHSMSLHALNTTIATGSFSVSDLRQRLDVLQQLGPLWEHWHTYYQLWLPLQVPRSFSAM